MADNFKKIGNWIYQDLPAVSSTNDAVLDLLHLCHAPCILSAAAQTKGRGRLGRSWEGCNGNLFVSFACEIPTKQITHYAIISALAVFNTIRFFAPDMLVQIKWPNDVLVSEKKISGILFEKGPDNYWVMGIGINVAHTPKIKNLLYEATSLADLNIQTNRLDVLTKLVSEFDTLRQIYQTSGFSYIKSLWLDNSYQRGNKVIIKQNGTEITGILKDLDANGNLILQTENGFQTLCAGDLYKKDNK